MLPNRTAVRLSSLVLLALDTALILLAWVLSFWLRFNLDVPDEFSSMAVESALLAVGSYWVAFVGMGVHRQVWRYIGLSELRQLAIAVFLASLLTAAAVLMLRVPSFPRSVLLLHPLIVLMLLFP